MEYRKLPHGNEKISVLGMGTSVVGEASEKNVVETITYAPVLANKVLDMGLIDMIMFSINPMYDFGQGDFSIGSSSERYSLYSRCEKEGVGISVMKPFNAGQLLSAKTSPFHQALTPAQCIQYALDRPGVISVIQGAANVEQLKQNLAFLDATEEEKDYSVISSLTPDDTKGKCVYCKHCHPCPSGIHCRNLISCKQDRQIYIY